MEYPTKGVLMCVSCCLISYAGAEYVMQTQQMFADNGVTIPRPLVMLASLLFPVVMRNVCQGGKGWRGRGGGGGKGWWVGGGGGSSTSSNDAAELAALEVLKRKTDTGSEKKTF